MLLQTGCRLPSQVTLSWGLHPRVVITGLPKGNWFLCGRNIGWEGEPVNNVRFRCRSKTSNYKVGTGSGRLLNMLNLSRHGMYFPLPFHPQGEYDAGVCEGSFTITPVPLQTEVLHVLFSYGTQTRVQTLSHSVGIAVRTIEF